MTCSKFILRMTARYGARMIFGKSLRFANPQGLNSSKGYVTVFFFQGHGASNKPQKRSGPQCCCAKSNSITGRFTCWINIIAKSCDSTSMERSMLFRVCINKNLDSTFSILFIHLLRLPSHPCLWSLQSIPVISAWTPEAPRQLWDTNRERVKLRIATPPKKLHTLY